MKAVVLLVSAAFSVVGVPTGWGQSSRTPQIATSDNEFRSSAGAARTPGTPDSSGIESSTLTPDLFVGAASYSYPLRLLRGRSGMTPKLGLVYRSDAGSGPYGVGWSLEFGAIERSSILGVNYDEKDFVFVKGKLRESLVELDNSGDTFVEKIQGTFQHFRQLRDAAGATYWVLTDSYGVRYFFGQTSASRQDDPKDGSRVFKWCLDRIEDLNGNFMSAEYTKDDGQIYLSSIEYTGHVKDLEPTTAVVFERSARKDVNSDFQLGFRVRTNYVVTAIKLSQTQETGKPEQVREYSLSYDDQVASTSRSTLVSVTEIGQGGIKERLSTTFSYGQDGKSWVTVGWPGPNIDLGGHCFSGNFHGSGSTQLACLAVPGNSWSVGVFLGSAAGSAGVVEPWPKGPSSIIPVGNKCFVGDFNGDSRSDIACYKDAGVWEVALSTGSGWNTSQWTGGTVPTGIFRNACVSGDFDGDGRTDYACHLGNAVWQVSVSTGSAWIPLEKTWDNGVAPAVPFSNQCLATDFNGDGITDLACHLGSGNWEVSLSMAAKWAPKQTWGSGPVPDPVFSNRCVLGDFNADGKADVGCVLTGGDWQIGLSTGTAWETTKWSGGPNPTLPLSKSTLVGDFNGDGKTDLLFHGSGWGASCGDKTSSWKDRPWQRQYPELCQEISRECFEEGDVSEEDSAVVDGRWQKRWRAHCRKHSADWEVGASTGNGWLTSSWPGGLALFENAGERCIVGDFSGGARSSVACVTAGTVYQVMLPSGDLPDLLLTVENSTGGILRLGYGTSAKPLGTQMPFSIPVIASLSMDDGNGTAALEKYEFSGGFFHVGEREFRGFSAARVTKQLESPISGGANPVATIQTLMFHQGNETEPISDDPTVKDGFMKGRTYSIEIADSTGKKYLSTRVKYVPPDLKGKKLAPPYFSPVEDVETTLIEGAAGTTVDHFHYDEFLNLDREQHKGPGTTSPKRTIVTTYARLGGTEIVGLPISKKVFDDNVGGTPMLVAKRLYFYDDVTDDCSRLASGPQIRGNLTRQQQWLSAEFKTKHEVDPEQWNGYDQYGNQVCARDARGNTRRFEFDSSRTYITRILGPVTHQKFELAYFGVEGLSSEGGSFGLVQSITEYNGNRFTFLYDGLGRLVRTVRPDLSWTSWAYKQFGLVGKQSIKIDTSQHLGVETYFDGFEREILTRKTGPNCKTILTKTEYHQSGLVKSVSVPSFDSVSPATTLYAHDPLGRVLSVRHADGSQESFCYSGLVTARIDPNGHRHREVRDIEGRILSTQDYEGRYMTCTTDLNTLFTSEDKEQLQKLITIPKLNIRQPVSTAQFFYDVLGNLIRYQDALGRDTTFLYDNLSRLRDSKSPDRGVIRFTYDLAGNVTSKQYSGAAGIPTVYYSYDPLNRLVQKDFGTRKLKSAADWEFIYDEPRGAGIGHLTTVRRRNSDKRRYYYDSLGRVVKKELMATQQFTTTFDYDDADRISAIRYPDGSTTTYGYDGPFIERVKSSRPGKTIVELSDYTPLGQPGQISYGNAITTHYSYCELANKDCPKASYRTKSISTREGKNAIHKLTYDYDDVGNVVELSDTDSGNHIYVYDYLDRLIAHGKSRKGRLTTQPQFEWTALAPVSAMIAELNGSFAQAAWPDWWSYDAVGNIRFNSNVGEYAYPTSGVIPANAPISAGDTKFTYWPTGALRRAKSTSKQTTFNYDEDNQLVEVKKDGVSTQFAYDWDGRRVERSGAREKTTQYLDDGYECRGNACGEAVVIQGKRLAIVGKKTIDFYHLDDLGSVRLITDDSGKLSSQSTYAPFGDPKEIADNSSDKFRFAGNEFDRSTGLYYVGARYLDPAIGRFISADAVLRHGASSQGWNAYSYALNNPLSWRDASGYDAERTGWNRIAQYALIGGAGAAGLYLAPFTGGTSVPAAFEVIAALSAGMAMSSGLVGVVVGGVEVGTGQHIEAEEALATARGPGALLGELYSTAAGRDPEGRAAAREIGESIQTGFEFSRISVSIFKASGAFGSVASQPGLEPREGLAGLVAVGAYLGGKAIPADSASRGRIDKDVFGSHETPEHEKPTVEHHHREASVTVEWNHEHIDLRPDRPEKSEPPEQPDQPEVIIHPPN
jgi:RHS repeat-associated protein